MRTRFQKRSEIQRGTGVANVSDDNGRKLKLAFGPMIARFFQRLISFGGFDYWIYRIGGVNEKNQYSWAIISDSKKRFIFLLTREKIISADLKNKILEATKEDGLPVEKLVYLQK